MDLGHLMNPRFDVRFEERTLYVEYTFEKDIDVVFMPIWSFMSQFDIFLGQNLLNELSATGVAGNLPSLSLWIG
ncbi:MAG: hypothetical protein FWC20_03980 [Oscillospiraceae bacterium]|nr:hypothetical protein [Oscillospiraceae bacterium]